MRHPRLQVRDVLGNWNVVIAQTPFTMGRRETNHLRLGAAEVSREHAEIVEQNGRYLIRDRQSRYGTFVGGEPVTECELRPGDEIRLGRAGGTTLVFLGADDSTVEATPNPREGLRQMTELLERLRGLGAGRLLQDVLALLLDAALELTHAERGFVMLAGTDGQLEFRMGRGPTGQALTDVTFETSRQVPTEVFRTGQTLVLQDLSADGVADDHAATRDLGIRHIICVPLHLVRLVDAGEVAPEERRLGVLYLDGTGRGSMVSPVTQSALETLAAEASLAIENARLYRQQLEKTRIDQELRLAYLLQQSLLPRPTMTLAFVEAAATSRPCRSIGGDFFDYPRQASPAFSFALGDVAGKGPPAALLSAMMQGMFAFASKGQFAEGPASIITTINQALCLHALEVQFVTLFLGVISEDGRLTYCNAGHCPPVIVSATGVQRLECGGPVCGLFDAARYEQAEVSLDSGDAVVVYSDGVTEAVDAAEEEFGESRLLDAIAQAGTGNAQALVDAVIDAVQRHTAGTAQNDDVTLMAIRYRGVSGVRDRPALSGER